jgi:hypothetical protein
VRGSRLIVPGEPQRLKPSYESGLFTARLKPGPFKTKSKIPETTDLSGFGLGEKPGGTGGLADSALGKVRVEGVSWVDFGPFWDYD